MSDHCGVASHRTVIDLWEGGAVGCDDPREASCGEVVRSDTIGLAFDARWTFTASKVDVRQLPVKAEADGSGWTFYRDEVTSNVYAVAKVVLDADGVVAFGDGPDSTEVCFHVDTARFDRDDAVDAMFPVPAEVMPESECYLHNGVAFVSTNLLLKRVLGPVEPVLQRSFDVWCEQTGADRCALRTVTAFAEAARLEVSGVDIDWMSSADAQSMLDDDLVALPLRGEEGCAVTAVAPGGFDVLRCPPTFFRCDPGVVPDWSSSQLGFLCKRCFRDGGGGFGGVDMSGVHILHLESGGVDDVVGGVLLHVRDPRCPVCDGPMRVTSPSVLEALVELRHPVVRRRNWDADAILGLLGEGDVDV